MSIGFIGIGTMGKPMVRNLIDAGHDMVLHDTNPATYNDFNFDAVTIAQSPAEVAASTEVIFTSLPGPSELESVTLGKGGIIEGINPDAVQVDTSTVSPSTIEKISKEFSKISAHLIDAPVSGGPIGAESGKLAIMVGGDIAVFDKVKPILEILGSSITRVGPTGSGTVAKLVHNGISMSTRIAVQEGMILAVKYGIHPTDILNVLTHGSFGQQTLLKSHIPDLVFKDDFDNPRFSLALSEKDVSLALAFAEEMGLEFGMAERALSRIREGVDKGLGAKDNLVTYKVAEEKAGVQVRG